MVLQRERSENLWVEKGGELLTIVAICVYNIKK